MEDKIIAKMKEGVATHAYLIYGSLAARKKFIQNITETLEIKAADLILTDETRVIGIGEIRDIIKKVSLKPHSSQYKLVVFGEGSNITPEGTHALLKTLEEPPGHSIFIIGAWSKDSLLPTIVSRCQKVRLPAGAIDELSNQEMTLFHEIPEMSVKEKFDLAKDLYQNEDLKKLLDHLIIFYREKLFAGEEMSEIIKMINRYRQLLNFNINTRLLLENLFLELSKI